MYKGYKHNSVLWTDHAQDYAITITGDELGDL